jgi:hypothetical protein
MRQHVLSMHSSGMILLTGTLAPPCNFVIAGLRSHWNYCGFHSFECLC